MKRFKILKTRGFFLTNLSTIFLLLFSAVPNIAQAQQPPPPPSAGAPMNAVPADSPIIEKLVITPMSILVQFPVLLGPPTPPLPPVHLTIEVSVKDPQGPDDVVDIDTYEQFRGVENVKIGPLPWVKSIVGDTAVFKFETDMNLTGFPARPFVFIPIARDRVGNLSPDIAARIVLYHRAK